MITGGAGFVGASLIRKLLHAGYSVNLILKKSTKLERIKDLLSKLKVYEVDLLAKNNLQKTIYKIQPSIIFHLATFSDYRNQEDFEEMVEVNVKGTMNLLLASRDIDYKVFVNTGSSSEYGFKKNPMNEKDLLCPLSFYAATKASATLLCQVFAREYHKPIVTFRPFSVYGPYEEESRFIPTIIRSIIEKRPINLTIGAQRRDFVYIGDVADAYIKSIKKGKKLAGKILNIGTGKEYTNDEVVKILFKLTDLKVPVKKGAFPKRIWDSSYWVADISQTQILLNWKPKTSIEEGLGKTYEWFKNAKVQY